MLFTFSAPIMRPSWADEQSKTQIATFSGWRYSKISTVCFVCSISWSRFHHALWFFPGYIIFHASVNFRCCSAGSAACAAICSALSASQPEHSQIQLEMWIPWPLPFFFSSCWSDLSHWCLGLSFVLTRHSSCGRSICSFSPGARVSGIGSIVCCHLCTSVWLSGHGQFYFIW